MPTIITNEVLADVDGTCTPRSLRGLLAPGVVRTPIHDSANYLPAFIWPHDTMNCRCCSICDQWVGRTESRYPATHPARRVSERNSGPGRATDSYHIFTFGDGAVTKRRLAIRRGDLHFQVRPGGLSTKSVTEDFCCSKMKPY